MSENLKELHELEEMRVTYNLMDESLDGQEIVSDEKIREAMYRKFADIRQNLKEGLVWGNVVFVPVLAWHAWANDRLTLLGGIMLGVYWLASLVFNFVVLRKIKREDYGSYDLKTLVEREARYSNNIKWGSIATVVFFLLYFLQMFTSKNEAFIFIVMALTLMIPVTVRWLVIKYKYNGQVIDPATGKPRVLKVKWLRIVLYVLLGLVACLWVVAFVNTLANSTGWLVLIRVLNVVPLFMSIAVLVLGLLHQKGKITVSRRLLIILAAIAITLSASVVGIAMLMDFTELAKAGNLLTTALFSFLGLSSYKTRK
ncbi:MAG: hypothetical protein J5529_12930 [Prevotella sp.]|nr:hypothetical protein [Prevotella sp.]